MGVELTRNVNNKDEESKTSVDFGQKKRKMLKLSTFNSDLKRNDHKKKKINVDMRAKLAISLRGKKCERRSILIVYE